MERCADAPAPRFRGRCATDEALESSRKPTSRSATFTARPREAICALNLKAQMAVPLEKAGAQRRTCRVAGASTRGTMRQHDGVAAMCVRFCFCGKRSAQRAPASEGDRDRSVNSRERQRAGIAADSPARRGRPTLPLKDVPRLNRGKAFAPTMVTPTADACPRGAALRRECARDRAP